MDVETYQETCLTCGIVFWITKSHQQHLVKCKNPFYCPSGHQQYYSGETDAQKNEKLKRKVQNLEVRNESLGRSNSALRGVITRNKKK